MVQMGLFEDGANAQNSHRKGAKRKHGVGVTLQEVLRLLEVQEFKCALTGRELTPETATLDHVIPIQNGGEHKITNAQILHKDVNRAKNTMTNEEFVAMCREVVVCSDRSKTQEN